jgi:hypothetical protein
VLASVDWIEVSAIATAAAALATLSLALFTVKMAQQARRSADAGIRLAKSAEQDSQLLAQQFRAEHEPRVRWERTAEGVPLTMGDPDSFRVGFEHVGGPPAEIVSATLDGQPARVVDSRADRGADDIAYVTFAGPAEVPWGPVPVAVEYRAAAGGPSRRITARIRADEQQRLILRDLSE